MIWSQAKDAAPEEDRTAAHRESEIALLDLSWSRPPGHHSQRPCLVLHQTHNEKSPKVLLGTPWGSSPSAEKEKESPPERKYWLRA